MIALGVASWGQCDGANGAGLEGVGRRVVFEQLHVCAKLDAHAVEIRDSGTGDDGVGAHRGGDAVFPRELV